MFAGLGAGRAQGAGAAASGRASWSPTRSIIHKGERGREMFFISSGAVEVVLPNQRVRLGSGEFFGEMALLEPRAAGRPTSSRSAIAGCWC